VDLYESVPNFSEGRSIEVIGELVRAAQRAHCLDSDSDPDHNRVVISIAGSRENLTKALLACVGEAVDRIDLRHHRGVHPRVGAADVIPIVPLGGATLESSREVAHELAEQIWTQLRVPVFFYGHGEGKRLVDIRAGRATPDLGGPELHPTAGGVSVGARASLVAFNVILYDTDLVTARAIARSIRETTTGGLRGVQALVFQLSGHRVQLSMNLFRLDETTPSQLIAELERRGASVGAQELVGLCPAVAAVGPAAGRLLEGRLAATAAGAASRRAERIGDEEHRALASKLWKTSAAFMRLGVEQDSLLAGAEQCAALIPVMRAGGVLDDELQAMLDAAARGLRAAIVPATEAIYRERVNALDVRLSGGRV
jgi:glutamate formiminotransferase / 5-formyltetrahydrofolate cyclo-ligase